MIRHWVEAVGDENPVYTDAEAAAKSVHGEIVAPPVMLQAWVMRGVRPRPTDGGNARDELMTLLDDAGFTSVVATNCEQEYHRYLHLGDHLSTTTIIESVSDEKATGLGVGHFVTTRVDYRDRRRRARRHACGSASSSSSLGPAVRRRRRRKIRGRCDRGPRSPTTTRSGSRAPASTGC